MIIMENKKINKKHLFVYIFLFVSIIFVTLSTTYAWYDDETATYKNEIETTASASNEGIDLTSTSISVSDLVPASEEEVKTSSFTLDDTQCKNENGDSICFLYEFTVTNNNIKYQNILYYLTPIENTFTNLKFKIYNSPKNELSETSKINMLATPLTRNDLNQIELTGMTRKISANVSMTYTIVFWIEKQAEDQTIADAAKSFKAELAVDLIATGYGYVDADAPVVSNVTLVEDTRTYGDGNLGNYTVSWEAADAKSEITKYLVNIYNSSGELQFTDEITDAATYSKTYNGLTGTTPLSSGDYYATVYAEDSVGNSGVSECSVEGSIYCGKSATTNIKYKLLYKSSTSYSTFSMSTAADSIVYGGSATFTVNKGSASGYTYTFGSWSATYSDGTSIKSGSSTGTQTISNLTNDFKISVTSTRKENTSSCLAEGTRILLANGKYKNIEDITYDDLLVVIDYQNGGITYQYPNWIEKRLLSDSYIKITFSDDTTIDVVGDHAFFSYDASEFVVVSDKEKFNIGTRVAKLKDNKIEEVQVKNIEYIEEEVYYHNVISTRYYNIIANDLVTTDNVLFITNLYGFNKDITWKNPVTTDFYTREELNILPNYLFRGLRAREGKYLNNFGINYDMFIYYLQTNQLLETIWDEPKLNNNGKRQWMVTTSDDIVNEENKSSYIMEEGDYYILKEPIRKDNKRFIGWYHTGENTIHQPGEKIEVLYGTHFIAKWEEPFNYKYNNNLIK